MFRSDPDQDPTCFKIRIRLFIRFIPQCRIRPKHPELNGSGSATLHQYVMDGIRENVYQNILKQEYTFFCSTSYIIYVSKIE